MKTPLTSDVTPAGASIGRNSATVQAMQLVMRGKKLRLPKSRVANSAEINTIFELISIYRLSLIENYYRYASKQSDLTSQIIAILNRASTYKARTSFSDPDAMLPIIKSLEQIIKQSQKIFFVLPIGGGKLPNPLKTGDNFLPDLTEWIAYSMLSAIAEAIGKIYKPGATVVTIPDTPLHTGDLAFPEPDGYLHRNMLRQDLHSLDISKTVQVVETTNYLPIEWPSEVLLRMRNAYKRMKMDPDFATNVNEQVRSLIYGQNIRSTYWDYEHSVLVNAALAGFTDYMPDEVLRDASEIYNQTQRIAYHYVGVNHSLRTLDIPKRIVKELSGSNSYIRLSVHAKRSEPRPMLAQNNERARPGLIPLHSVPLQFYNKKGIYRIANIFEVEARVNNYRPVVEKQTNRILFYETMNTQ